MLLLGPRISFFALLFLLCYSKVKLTNLNLLMHVCAEPESSVVLLAYPLDTVLPEHLVCGRRRAANSCSLPVSLSPESLALT